MKNIRHLFLNEKFILLIIFINAIIIFLQGFGLKPVIHNILIQADNIITILFIIEMLIKIKHYSIKGYFSDNWNTFDFILITLAIPSLILWITNIYLIDIEYLLVLRITRVFKFFRFLRFFPQIDSLIKGVSRALKASIVVLIGFFIFIFIISIISTFLFGEISPEYFGNPLKSFYSVFKVFTVEGWYEIPDQIANSAYMNSQLLGIFINIFFSLILLIGGIFGLSIVDSIFVDAMVSDNNDELEEKVSLLENKIDLLIKELKKK